MPERSGGCGLASANALGEHGQRGRRDWDSPPVPGTTRAPPEMHRHSPPSGVGRPGNVACLEGVTAARAGHRHVSMWDGAVPVRRPWGRRQARNGWGASAINQHLRHRGAAMPRSVPWFDPLCRHARPTTIGWQSAGVNPSSRAYCMLGDRLGQRLVGTGAAAGQSHDCNSPCRWQNSDTVSITGRSACALRLEPAGYLGPGLSRGLQCGFPNGAWIVTALDKCFKPFEKTTPSGGFRRPCPALGSAPLRGGSRGRPTYRQLSGA
jgi:hypothetical protein